MKRKLLSLAIASTLSLGGVASLCAQQPPPGDVGEHHHHHHGDGPKGHGGRGEWGNPLEHLTKELNLTPDQQAKVTPIIDTAKPQIIAIHKEAMEKTKLVMESAGEQIRPLLTPEQQQKFDAMKQRHEEKREARQQ